jgi:hypothetical protein
MAAERPPHKTRPTASKTKMGPSGPFLFCPPSAVWAFEPCSTQAPPQAELRTRSVHPTLSANKSGS